MLLNRLVSQREPSSRIVRRIYTLSAKRPPVPRAACARVRVRPAAPAEGLQCIYNVSG